MLTSQTHHKTRSIPVSLLKSWLPESVRNKPPRAFRLSFSASERRIFRKPKKILPSEWCEKHRIVTMSSRPGRWKNITTPYLVGILDASFFTGVEKISVCASPQTGKSELGNNCVGFAADRAPGPTLYVYPDEKTAKDNSQDRIQPMFRSSPRLASYLSPLGDDTSAMRINLIHMPIYMSWASSPARLANKPIRYVVFDEVDKYGETAGKREADPISLGEARTTTYRWSRKVWKFSTPTVESGPIWQAVTVDAQVLFKYQVRCPICSTRQIMSFEQIRWPDDLRDPNKIEAENLAWYECIECKAKWEDYLRDKAVLAGHWVNEADGRELFSYLRTYRPKNIGFHLPSWLSPFVPFGEIAAEFLRSRVPGSKKMNIGRYRNFYNKYKAEPFLQYPHARDEDKILALADGRPRGMVPGLGQVACLLFGADVHNEGKGINYIIKAFGYGMINEQWLVQEGIVDSFEALAERLWEYEYKDAAGLVYPVHFGLIDSRWRTAEVYDFCRQHRGKVLPAMGQKTKAQPFSFSNIENYPGTKKAIPGGLMRVMVHTNHYKDALASKLEVAATDPGAYHMHSEISDAYAAQMCAETTDDQGFWVQIGNRPNHFWDCDALSLVAADIKDVKIWKDPKILIENQQTSNKSAKATTKSRRW